MRRLRRRPIIEEAYCIERGKWKDGRAYTAIIRSGKPLAYVEFEAEACTWLLYFKNERSEAELRGRYQTRAEAESEMFKLFVKTLLK